MTKPPSWPEPQNVLAFMIIAIFAVAYFVHYDAEMNDALVTAFVAVVGYSIGVNAGARRVETK